MAQRWNLPPAAPGLPVFGSTFEFGKDPFTFFLKARGQANRGVYYQKSLGMHCFILFDDDLIEHVLVKNSRNYVKNKFLKSMDEVFGSGLLTSDGEEWKRDRKLINPLFTRERISEYASLIAQVSSDRFSSWEVGKEIDASAAMKSTTLEVFVRTLLGESLPKETEDKFARATRGCEDYINFVSSGVGFLLRKFPTPSRIRFKKHLAEIDQVIAETVERHSSSAEGRDLATQLVRARGEDGESLSTRKLRDQLITFFEAGHETTALMLAFIIHLISKHPEVQRKLRQELSALQGANAISAADLQKLPYLRQVVQEGLRYYPTSWMVGRDSVGPDRLRDWDVPPDSTVMIPTWALHRDPQTYPEPEVFRPERWTPEFEKSLPRTRFIPFGYGGRMCIGFHFAMLELQLVLADLYRRFGTELLSETELKLRAVVTAQPTSPIRVRVTE